MKRKIKIISLAAVLGLFLFFPDQMSRGAKEGLILWFSIVFPALLPFMVVSGVIVRLGITSSIGRVMYPFVHKWLHVSENGCYPVVVGLLSGYPLGAKTVADLCVSGKISRREGQYLLTFCNNSSPMFMLEYMGVYCMGLKNPEFLLVAVYLSAILNALLYQKHFGCYHGGDNVVKYSCNGKKEAFLMGALDESILDSFVTLAKVGGYIILFSILAQLVEELLPLTLLLKVAGLGMIEITTGGEYLRSFIMDGRKIWILGTVFCAFGGFSSIAQTSSVLQGSGLSIKKYIVAKTTHALLAAGVAALMCFLVV